MALPNTDTILSWRFGAPEHKKGALARNQPPFSPPCSQKMPVLSALYQIEGYFTKNAFVRKIHAWIHGYERRTTTCWLIDLDEFKTADDYGDSDFGTAYLLVLLFFLFTYLFILPWRFWHFWAQKLGLLSPYSLFILRALCLTSVSSSLPINLL